MPVKIATWNINSIRARTERLLAWLPKANPDVLCLQELKCTTEQFPSAELTALGYQSHVHGQKSYNGVAIISRLPVTDVVHGFVDGVDDEQARCISGTVAGLRLYCLYAPNGQEPDSEAYQFKLEWYARLQRVIGKQHKATDPVLLTGDFNVAPEDIDVWDPRLFAGQTLFTLPERKAFTALKDSLQMTDLYRAHHTEPGKFSWWDYRMLGFPKNHGLRIDHFLSTDPVTSRCTATDIDREARKGKLPSDHAPVWVELADT